MQSKLDLLAAAVEQWQRTDTPVSPAPTAIELEALIDVSLNQEGSGAAAIETAIHDYIKYSPNASRPEFFKLLYSGLNPEALLGEWVASLTNSTMHTYQVGPVATLMELELIAQCNRLIGFNTGSDDTADGVMVAGGSQANLIGMLLARHRVLPQCKRQGLTGGRKTLRAYVSDQAHYSFERAINLLGLGSDNLVKVPSDELGRILPSALRQCIDDDIEQGRQPFFVGLTAGTTVVGAFDPIAACKEIADRHGIWLHIDAAWGAPVLFSDRHNHLLAGSELADSFAWDAHKLMNVPITAAFILVKSSGQLKEAIAGGGGDYLFHQDANADYNLGEKSIQCGRRADSLKVWLSWKAKGHQGFAKKVDDLQQLKQECLDLIAESEYLEMLGPADFLNILFRFKPEVGSEEPAIAELNKRICKLMVSRGGPHVDYAQYKGRTGIRLILGNDRTALADLRELLSQVVEIGLEINRA